MSTKSRSIFSKILVALLWHTSACEDAFAQQLAPSKKVGVVRVATFNVSLSRSEAGKLTRDLQSASEAQAAKIAAIIRDVQPDVLLLNELDYSKEADHAALFHDNYLADPKLDALGGKPWTMPYRFAAPVNTGVPSGLDVNQNGSTDEPDDCWGFGFFPGQYGMAVLSRYEIDSHATRTFQKLLWSELPGALEPEDPNAGKKFYPPDTWKQLRLPSKSLWDVVVKIPGGPLHVLASHPTPPVFDREEDRNGRRNHDEIRLLVEYINGKVLRPTSGSRENFWIDDQGRSGALREKSLFVIVGDLNCDPSDGDGRHEAAQQLLTHPNVQSNPTPASLGAVYATKTQGGRNATHRGDPSQDTGDFNDSSVGNLRIDYVLPSVGFKIVDCGVVWPEVSNGNSAPILNQLNDASDHHMVWVDLIPNPQ